MQFFQGINIDFKHLVENTIGPLTLFRGALHETPQAKGFAVMQDISPMNDNYDYQKLSHFNDHILLMGYDWFNGSTKAGTIGSHKWIEQAVARTTQ